MPDLPSGLKKWLDERGCPNPRMDTAAIPANSDKRNFALATVPLGGLDFQDHSYNPRVPNPGKINEIAGSIQYLSLITPLTCAWIEKPQQAGSKHKENLVLLDGRHRFEALKQIAADNKDFRETAKIDLKIYWGLKRADLFVLATYLNRSRRNLRKGEYYKFIVKIFEEKLEELQSGKKTPVIEREVFNAISSEQLTDRDFDLSVGRIVGEAAFDAENADSWFPMVGTHQSYRVEENLEAGHPLRGKIEGYCPMTAGNLGDFLRPLCKTGPYDDRGETRSVELQNAIELGVLFRERILVPVEQRDEASRATMACKHWPLVAFGSALKRCSIFAQGKSAAHPLAQSDIDWDVLAKVVDAYGNVMEEQATLLRAYKVKPSTEALRKVWAYQTQRGQILPHLEEELTNRVKGLTIAEAPA